MKKFIPFGILFLAAGALASLGSTKYIEGDLWRNPAQTKIFTPPAATDTLMGVSATQTPINKTISGSTNTITNVSLTTGVTGTLPILNGGTGQTTKAAAFDALQPMSASGDIIYGGTSGTGTRLAKATDGQKLTLVSGLPAWASGNANLSVSTKTTTYTTLATDNVILFSSAGGAYTINLVTAVGNSGLVQYFKKTDSTNIVTIDPNGTQTIDGALTVKMAANNDTLTLISDGANWKILDRNIKLVMRVSAANFNVVSNAIAVKFPTVVEDVYSTYSTSTGVFTVPVGGAGEYVIGWCVGQAAAQLNQDLQINGSTVATALYSVGGNACNQGYYSATLADGDTVNVYNNAGGSYTTTANATDNRFEVRRLR